MAMIIAPRIHDLGGFNVRRVLPSSQARNVGPFVFVDHMGPHVFARGQAVDVRPHPHIGLATITWLWEGRFMHRDSLGHEQEIAPGEVNWMTAGSGIVHSERTPQHLRGGEHPLHGMQTWVALPRAHEEVAPAFEHFAAAAMPVLERPGLRLTVVAGRSFGLESPVAVFADTLYAAVELDAGAELTVTAEHAERALYVFSGEVALDDAEAPSRHLIVLDPGRPARVRARTAARLMVLGGEPLDGPRHLWWNFVHSSRERIEQAKQDWRAGRFGAVPGETEFIPLPEG